MTKDIKRAPNIYETPYGWRVYVRDIHPKTGKSWLRPIRFKRYDERLGGLVTVAKLEAYREKHKLRVKERRAAAPATPRLHPDDTLRADAARYLELPKVKQMPSYATRTIEIAKWVTIFGDRDRRSIASTEIDNELQKLRDGGYSGSTVNKFRTALMSLWTRLDGRSAANPVKDTGVFEEAALETHARSYDDIVRILDMIPEERGPEINREQVYREVWRKPMTAIASRYHVSASYLGRVCRQLNVPVPPRGYWTIAASARPPRPPLPLSTQVARVPTANENRARLEVLAWTGMDPSQLARMGRDHVSMEKRQYVAPHRQKGSRRRQAPKAVIAKPMSEEAAPAFQRLLDLDALRPFDTRALRRVLLRAQDRLEQKLRDEFGDPSFHLPRIKRLKVLRHSFGTKLYEELANTKGERAALELVGQMLDHAPGSPMTIRYSLGAVPSVLRQHVGKFPRRQARRRTKAKVRA